jgi:hypothetical protein
MKSQNHSAEGAEYKSQNHSAEGAEYKSQNHSAEGAEYKSQGQARSASPLVHYEIKINGLKGRNKKHCDPVFRPFRAEVNFS